MNNKVLAGVVVVIVVVVIAAAAIVGFGGNDQEGVTTGVNYHGNGGVTSEGEEVFGLTSETVSMNLFTYDGMIFQGWNTSADGSGEDYAEGDTIVYGDGAVDLYAQWVYAMNVTVGHVSSGGGLTGYLALGGDEFENIGFGPVALPETGMVSVVFTGAPDDTVWTYDEETTTFTGTCSECTYEVRLALDGVTDITDFSTGSDCWFVIGYDGPVTGEITVVNSPVYG